METELKQRLRLRFSKRGRMRFISHHDLMRLFERAVRRAGIPVRMTSGFNPHPRISFPLALGVGVESGAEVAEMSLHTWMPAEELKEKLNAALPEGISVESATPIAPGEKAEVSDVTYEIILRRPRPDLAEKARSLLAREEVPVERKKKDKSKQVDIRPFLLDITADYDRMVIWLKVTPSGTTNPEEVLRALGINDESELKLCSVERSQINLITDKESKRRKRGNR